MESLEEALTTELAAIRAAGRGRWLRRFETVPAPAAVVDGRALTIFGSNDYLGLATHPTVRAAAAAAVQEWGTGAGASRLVTGNLALHESLEAELAAWKGAEAAILFASGYHAAVGTIPALAGAGDLILSDALNHASLIDGCRLSRAELRVYRHGDLEHLDRLLVDRERFRRCLVITDGVFSMDGDLAPLPELVDLSARRDAWLVVDDAHGSGVLGPGGTGTAAALGVAGRVPVQLGTLSKALAAQGGFVAGSQRLVDFLRNRARSFIFSTGLVPAAAAAARAALALAIAEPARRERLRENAAWLRRELAALGFRVPAGETPILPLVLGDERAALQLSDRLAAAGVLVPAIRPPSVPPGTSRLRLTVSASHEPEHLEQARAAFAAVLPGLEEA
jgi:8-amino-7-oxononanoate synthase